MSNRRFRLSRQFTCKVAVSLGLILFVIGCSAKKPSFAGNYQGTWKTDKHDGLIEFGIGLDGVLVGHLDQDQTSVGPLPLGGPIEEDGSYSLKLGSNDQLNGYLELSDSGIIKGHGVLKLSRHTIDFTLRRVVPSGTATDDSQASQISSAQTREVPQQTQVQATSTPTALPQGATPQAPAQSATLYYAALLTRTSDLKQAYVLWTVRDGTKAEFENRVMRDSLPQRILESNSRCEVTFMNFDQLPTTAAKLQDIESVNRFANP